MCMQGDGIYDALMARGDALLSGHSATFTDTRDTRMCTRGQQKSTRLHTVCSSNGVAQLCEPGPRRACRSFGIHRDDWL